MPVDGGRGENSTRASDPACPGCGMTAQVEPSRSEPGRWMCHGCAQTFDSPAAVPDVTESLFDAIRTSLNQLTDHGSQKCLECLHHRQVAMDAMDELERFYKETVTKPADSPITKGKAPRRGNVRGHDMTEVTAMQGKSTQSGDTNNSVGRIVGVEDADGRAWCFECAHDEIRRVGETAFMVDLYAWSARRKCVNCKRLIGEVTG